jgi:APA family basic amino acid/polyamine antiporter
MKTLVEPQVEEKLARVIGVPGLTANIVNTTIGASIFVLPAATYKTLGTAAPMAFVICALAMALFVTCFALAGSRVSLTGGLYAYIEVAFGRYVGFVAGLLYFVMAVLSVAAIMTVLVGAAVTIAPVLTSDGARAALMFLIYAGLALLNIRSVRAGTGAVAVTTIVKLIPLLIFIAAGIFFIKPASLTIGAWPGSKPMGDSILLLLFAFFGIEVALVPSGEVRNTARTVPRAIYASLIVTTAVYFLIQLVAQGTLGPRLAENATSPLAEAAATFLGHFGRLMLLAAATVSSFGFVTSDILSSPRILFALARDGMLPRTLAHVHPRFHSPDVAIFVYSAIAFAFSVTSTFESLAVMANVAALLLYLLCCAAAWQLMRRDVRTNATPFNFPGARIIPVISIAVITWILAHATRREWLVNGGIVALGSIVYLVRATIAREQSTSR